MTLKDRWRLQNVIFIITSSYFNKYMLFESSISSSSRADSSARSNSNRVELLKAFARSKFSSSSQTKRVCSIELENFELRAKKSCSMFDSNSTRLDSKAISGSAVDDYCR